MSTWGFAQGRINQHRQVAGSDNHPKEPPKVAGPLHRIDEYGYPWFDVVLKDADGTVHEHSLAIMEDDSWDFEA